MALAAGSEECVVRDDTLVRLPDARDVRPGAVLGEVSEESYPTPADVKRAVQRGRWNLAVHDGHPVMRSGVDGRPVSPAESDVPANRLEPQDEEVHALAGPRWPHRRRGIAVTAH